MAQVSEPIVTSVVRAQPREQPQPVAPCAPPPALATRRWRGPRRAPSSPPLGRGRFSAEPRQNAFGGFQLIEPVGQLYPLAIEPREPLGNPLLLLPNVVQCRHLMVPPRRG